MTGAVVSRIKHGAEIIIPTAHSVLKKDDLIRVVGNDRSFEQVKLLIGEQVDEDIPFTQTQELQSLLLTNKNIIGHTLGELNLQSSFGCTVTRVRRSGIDLIAEPNLALKFGDKLMVAGEKQSLDELSQYVGNDEKKLSDTDFFPIAMGIVLGVLFGKLSLSFSDSFSFSPGLTGGILMVALILSAVGKTGPIIWSMSGPANQLLRQLGLLFFLSEVGTSAGSNLVATFQEKRLDTVWCRDGHHPRSDDRRPGVRIQGIQNKYPRSARNHCWRNDQHTRTGSSRFDGRQLGSQHCLRYGLSHCHGLPDLVHPVHCWGLSKQAFLQIVH